MQEIFKDINNEVKEMAEFIWNVAIAQPDPKAAAQFLTNAINILKTTYNEREIEFLQFYFNMKMEMMKE